MQLNTNYVPDDISLYLKNSQLLTTNTNLFCSFNDYANRNPTTFLSLTETKSYIPITGCVLEHILTTTNLTNTPTVFKDIILPTDLMRVYRCESGN